MTMSYEQCCNDVISAHYSNKTSAKSIDKICAKLHLHINPRNNRNANLVEQLKEIADLSVDLRADQITENKEGISSVSSDAYKTEVSRETDSRYSLDMYSSGSPTSSYHNGSSPPPLCDSLTLSSTQVSSSSPSNISSHDNARTRYENSCNNSSVIVCTHGNTTISYDNICPVSPVFVSTSHDIISMSYDNIQPSSPVIGHMVNTSTVCFKDTRSSSPVIATTEETFVSGESVSFTTSTVAAAREGVTNLIDGVSTNSPVGEKLDSEKVEPKANKLKPRHTTQYNNWHHNDMIMAIKAVQMKYLSMTAAAKRYGIPRTTLRHYLHDGTNRETKRACFSLPKKSEENLVEFALQNCHVNEKTLYKLIFDKAKEFSQEAVLDTGEDGRRIVPTPAWIRRFVYRHKQLHDIFPTFLAKWEHPVATERKIVSDNDLLNCASTHDNMKVGKDKVCTEIIFPKGKYENFYSSDIYDTNASKKCDDTNNDKQILSRINNVVSPVNSILSRTKNDIHESYRDAEAHNMAVKKEHYASDDERIIPYKNLLSRITKPDFSSNLTSQNSHINYQNESIMYNHYLPHERGRSIDATSNRSLNDLSDLRNSHDYMNLTPLPMIRPNRYSPRDDSTSSSIAEILTTNDTDEGKKDDVSYSDKLRSLVKPLVNENDLINDSGRCPEYEIMKVTLNAMEKGLGADYVQLFTERYRRNKTLERLYGKWVSLRSAIDLQEKS